MAKLLLIKLGGSLITDKSKEFTAKPDVILRLAKEIMSAKKSFAGKIILAHGSGSFGHSAASKFKTKDGMVNNSSVVGLPLVADAAIQINRIVMKQFVGAKMPAVSFSPASFLLAKNRHLKKAYTEPLFEALGLGFLPVLYGDIIFDQKQGFCIFSSETVLSILANESKSIFDDIKIVYCGNTDGVYDADGKTIPKITPKSFVNLKASITGSGQTDVTGGMLHKVEESLELSKKGIQTVIISGIHPGELKKAILGKKVRGTLISQD